ncbi:uncharacterized protein ASPGLDRAFT_1474532 [Aspergillus glaucus CBS 516.65]|uniref:Uncharacterized protein n=1 Tax=Aspergillus glaucus CBS 516.65 TaxID=1160497 RepID=A0A1L9VLQ6_ASPGL|nr:hypothetical protein ASPGLDRAFT_1474532 [Aspergillus glaucus CBS 516.65]OJJ84814.1 hypothetical protein ASPGLDRAFT_1474532 [Aspergillus glaucus CBS 516.65]
MYLISLRHLMLKSRMFSFLFFIFLFLLDPNCRPVLILFRFAGAAAISTTTTLPLPYLCCVPGLLTLGGIPVSLASFLLLDLDTAVFVSSIFFLLFYFKQLSPATLDPNISFHRVLPLSTSAHVNRECVVDHITHKSRRLFKPRDSFFLLSSI